MTESSLPLAGSLPLTGSIAIDLSDECLCFTGRLLADLGVDVVRVEPAQGDALRIAGPHLDGRDDVESGLRHLLYNAGKRSLALNFEAPGAWDLIDRLLARADVVIAPLRKSPEARRSLASERLRGVHPHLGLVDAVVKRGQELEASDLTGVAAGGIMYGLGYPDTAPDYPAGRLAYKQAGLVGAATATTMLYELRHGRPAGHGSISLQEAILSTTIHFANENVWLHAGEKPSRPGREIPTLVQAKDGGWVTFGITPNTTARFEAFALWLQERAGYDGLVGAEFPGEIWATPWGSEEHRALQQACASLPRDELCAEGQERGFLVVPVNSARDIVDDPHLRQRGNFIPVQHEALGRSIEMPRLPIRTTGYEPDPRPAPTLGQHSAEALADLACVDAEEYARLRERSIVVGPDTRVEVRGTPAARPALAAAPVRNRVLTRDDLPLAGVRVVDFCWQAAGPLITEMLANLGADVIKIESEARMDTLRNAVQPLQEPTIETGAFFQDCNTDKRSITLNLGTPDGIRIAKDLARDADVVTENWTTGVLKRLGLGYDELKKENPRIVVASFGVMGSWGPKSTWRGIGNSVVAMSGLHAHTGAPDRTPTGVLLHTDFTLAPLGMTAILAALLQREKTGVGAEIEIPQYEAGIHLLDTELIECLANGVSPERRGNRSPEMAPHGLFPCAGDDRWVAVSARDNIDWREICRVIGRDDLAARDDLSTLAGRKAAEEEIEDALSAWTSQQDVWQAAKQLQEASVPAGALEDIEDLVETDPSMQGFFLEFDHPHGIKFMAQNQPFLWNGERLPIRRAPFFGEHNDEVYRRELALSEEELTQLIVDGVIR